MGLDSEPVHTYRICSLYLTSDLIRAFAVATSIGGFATDPDLYAHAAGSFQETACGGILRRHRQRVLTLRQIRRQK